MKKIDNDENFEWNYGIALASMRKYQTAEESLLQVKSESYKKDLCYLMWLSRCYIMNGKPEDAWVLYKEFEEDQGMNNANDLFKLIELIANDCYRMGHFRYAAKAFNALEELVDDPSEDPEYWEGKRGSCIGAFQQVVAARQKKKEISTSEQEEIITDILAILLNTKNPQSGYVTKIIKRWALENGLGAMS
uniref:Uncharacterized protein n=1 Tax=Ditylum brightwellii TaxID=49249 RepID=A0A6U3R6Y2_9STRA|mmetsp:Transcript_25506/g.37953  ORF Transcript_25506/g.37953 Transcript_25506/m.37953 type:complete len:191 (+) Transcript_25506:157-729(+)